MILLLNRGVGMAGFIEGVDRGQLSLLPESLDQWVEESNPVRVIDAFVEQLDLDELASRWRNRPTSDGQATTRRCTSSSTSTAISTAFNRAGAWSAGGRHLALALVSAIRETGVVFAVIIGNISRRRHIDGERAAWS
jgi:hypothetical protein